MNEIELNVTLDEANVMLEALGQMPFQRVYTLIAKLQDQAAKQLNSAEQQAADVTQLDTKNKAVEG